MHIAYLDDSRDSATCIVTALVVPATEWRAVFGTIKTFRSNLKQSDGLFTRKEWHATDFIAGRGRIADRVITKGHRSRIFGDTLHMIAGTGAQGVCMFNAVFPRKDELRAYERTLNRINRTMREWGSQALLIWDMGKEAEYRRLARKMTVYNPIPSKFGAWAPGEPTKNIPLDWVIEDPVFKDSAESYFLQITDFCAYALLRRESPLASKSKYGLGTAFNALNPILFLNANTKDPEGIIRP
jgi:hypothetical protein